MLDRAQTRLLPAALGQVRIDGPADLLPGSGSAPAADLHAAGYGEPAIGRVLSPRRTVPGAACAHAGCPTRIVDAIGPDHS